MQYFTGSKEHNVVLRTLAVKQGLTLNEYGLFAGVIWMFLLHLTVIRTRAPGVAAFVVLVQYDFLNGALIVPIHLVYCYVLAAAYSRTPRADDPGSP